MLFGIQVKLVKTSVVICGGSLRAVTPSLSSEHAGAFPSLAVIGVKPYQAARLEHKFILFTPFSTISCQGHAVEYESVKVAQLSANEHGFHVSSGG